MKPLFAALLLLIASPAHADGLVDNVNGYTTGANGRLERFTGLLIDAKGRVAKLLDRRDKRPEKLDFKLDAKGRTLIPGIVDAHGHLLALGLQAARLDLSDTRSLAEAQAKLARWAADHPNARWIVGRGWDEDRWALGRAPTAADLDAAVADRPVWLERVDGHAALANSAALAAAGVDSRTAVPAGGRMAITDGRPSGLFVDAAMTLVSRFVPAPLPRERDAALMKAQEILLGSGITAATDMGTSAEDWNSFRRLGDAGRLRVRILSYAAGIDPLIAIAGGAPTPWLYDGRLRMIGLNLDLDGALGTRGAWLKADYADAPGERGLRLLDDARLRNLMSRAAMDGFQVALEAAGDAASEQALDAIEELSLTYKGDRRWRIEQSRFIDPADVHRLGGNGIIASVQPARTASEAVTAADRLGPSRALAVNAWRPMLDAGARLAFGTDFPAAAPDPFAGIAAAMEGGMLTVEQIFAAYTVNAAYAAFAEDRLGSLQPGRQADFLLVDRDIFATPAPADLRAAQVLETWISGARAWVRKP
jgi:predicted amidohydrolase YtcJ